jgi:hypothetical protein
VADNPASCTTKEKSGGFLLLDCHSITTGKTEYSIFPHNPENQIIHGVSISAQVENPVTETWGKLHLKISFINPSNNDPRTYLISLKGGIVNITEYYKDFKEGAKTSVVILPLEFHVLEVNYENENLTFLVDGKTVDFKPDLAPEFQWKDWALEVNISKQDDESKVLKAKIDWIAIQK